MDSGLSESGRRILTLFPDLPVSRNAAILELDRILDHDAPTISRYLKQTQHYGYGKRYTSAARVVNPLTPTVAIWVQL